MNNVIEIDRLSKRYRIGLREQRPETLVAAALNVLARPVSNFRRLRRLTAFGAGDAADGPDIVWALNDVSFQVPKGQIVGIIGRNGSGKSTLLKILSRVTEPTGGRAVIDGRIAALLEVGTGFHPDLSGRDNIYLNGTILGMRRAEIARKFDEIVDFSGVETFIDTPVKRYSSGMYVRLAFAVAAHLQPEILVVDEVLAVGDAEFQAKCLGKMRTVAGAGRTVLFVSHNMAAVRSLCRRVILLDSGRVVADGGAADTVARYLQSHTVEGAIASSAAIEQRVQGVINTETPAVRLREVAVSDEGGTPRQSFESDQAITVSVVFECFRRVEDLRVVVHVQDGNGLLLLSSQHLDDPDIVAKHFRLPPGLYRAACVFPPHTFGEQRFALDVHLNYLKVEHLVAERILTFDVTFKGYNNVLHGRNGNVYFRPLLSWQVQALHE